MQVKSEGIEMVVYGDIFLEDLRQYRVDNLAKIEMKALFPLWRKNTMQLVLEFQRLWPETAASPSAGTHPMKYLRCTP